MINYEVISQHVDHDQIITNVNLMNIKELICF